MTFQQKHAASGHFASTSNVEVTAASDCIWLAVKPDIASSVLDEIRPTLGCTKLLVSIAAGLSLDMLESHLAPGARVIRVMPNLASLVGEGASGFCRGKNATAQDAKMVKEMLDCAGHAEEVRRKMGGEETLA